MNMQKFVMTAIAAIAVLLSSSSTHTAYAQTLTLPPVVDLYQFLREGLTEEERIEEYGPKFAREEGVYNFVPSIRIWGWSENGRVAYSTVVEYDHNTYIKFTILNLVSDRVVFEHELSPTEEDENAWHAMLRDRGWPSGAEYNILRNNWLTAFFNAHINTLRRAMRTHNIIERQVEYRPLPINHNGEIFNVEIRATYFNRDSSAVDPEGDGIAGCPHHYWARIRDYSVVIHNGGGQSKTIKTSRNVCRMDVVLAGYFLSPFENRALVVVVEKQPMFFENAMLYFIFIGAHLETGFW